jgi:hypothetical protein
MPWCEDCDRFLTSTSMGEGGECPSCGRVLTAAPRAPWHFKLLLGATAGYLGWRVVQGVSWLVHKL